jgi:hypothetical protein
VAKFGKRVLGAAGAATLLGSLGALAACGGTGDTDGATESAKQALEGANVSIAIHDADGKRIGTGTGVLIAPKLVLTAAHLVAGNAKWSITTADGKATVMGHRALTKDWMDYDSLKAHPRKTDVAVIYLDHAINLPAYPKLATARQSDGASISRVRHAGQAFQTLSGSISHWRSFPYAYYADIPSSETLDTGGAVVNDKFEIVGVVTGRGLQTGKLHIARTDHMMTFLSPKVACAGGKIGVDGSLSIRTYGTPPTGTSSSGGSSSGGSSSGTGGSTDCDAAGGGSGSTGGGGGDDSDKCDDGGGSCSGDCSGSGGGGSSSGGTNSGGTNSGTSSSSSSGGTGTSSSGGTTSSGGTGSSSGGTNTGGSDTGTSSSSSSGGGGTSTSSSGGTGTGSSSGGTSTGGSDTGTSSGGTSGGGGTGTGTGGGTGAGGTSGGTSGGTDQCQGPSDNPDVCPPEPAGCVGPDCGGGTPDSTIDYGGSTGGTGGSSSGGPIIR